MKPVIGNKKNTPCIIFLREVADIISARLIFHGINKKQAEYISMGAIDDIRKDISGITIYFPKGISYDAENRRAEIYDRYKKGESIAEIAYDFKLSMQRIYVLIAEERNLIRESKLGD